MANTQHLVHNNKAIFHMDFTNLKNPLDIKNLINESVRYIRIQPLSSVLTLTTIQGMHFSNEIKDLFNDFIKGNKPYVKASAVVGMSGMQQIVYNGLMRVTGRDIKAFTSSEEAKNWLTGKN
jgi:hypothetical protein